MRKKIKELMSREEGFTLVELLAVIVILGLIVAIAIPSIGTLIDGAKQDTKDAEVTMVVDAARLWEIKDGNKLTTTTTDALTVADLITGGFLEMRDSKMVDTSTIIRDPATGKITVNATYAN